MTNRKKTKSNQRKPRSEEYKVEALKLVDTIGVTAAAAQLGVQTSQTYARSMPLSANTLRKYPLSANANYWASRHRATTPGSTAQLTQTGLVSTMR